MPNFVGDYNSADKISLAEVQMTELPLQEFNSSPPPAKRPEGDIFLLVYGYRFDHIMEPFYHFTRFLLITIQSDYGYEFLNKILAEYISNIVIK